MKSPILLGLTFAAAFLFANSDTALAARRHKAVRKAATPTKTLATVKNAATSAPALPRNPKAGPLYDVPRLTGIAIDGRANDWGNGGFRVEALAQLRDTKLPDPIDFDAAFRLAWDERGLLVLARVYDDVPLEATGDDFWSKDAVEFFVATRRGGFDFYQAAVSPGLDAAQSTLRTTFVDTHRNELLAKTPLAIDAARTRVPGGYVLEACLPWANLGITPMVGREISFQAQFDDVDGPAPGHIALWYPEAGASGDSTKMHRLRLALQSGPPLRAAAFAGYENFRRARFNVLATRELVGKVVEVRRPLRAVERAGASNVPQPKKSGEATASAPPRLGKAVLAASGARAAATVVLPMPAYGRSHGPLDIFVGGRRFTTITLPNPTPARRAALNEARLRFRPFVFAGTAFPTAEFEQPGLVEDLIGPYTIKCAYYDAAYNPVRAADKPGRYAAVVDIVNNEGQHFRRYATLFRQPKEGRWWRRDLTVSIEPPVEWGISPEVAEQQKAAIAEFLKGRLRRSFENDEESAIVLAGLYETLPGAPPPPERENVSSRNRNWMYNLKKKLGDGRLRYILEVPDEYLRDTSRNWPLLVFLHGSGEVGDDLEKVRANGPAALRNRDSAPNFPFLLLAPQSPVREGWLPEQVVDTIDEVATRYRVDPDRIYLCGLSMGGYGTWRTATAYPNRFAAAIPICGGGDPGEAARLKDVPLWVFHGARDTAVPIELSESMVEELRKIGGRVRFTVYPEAGHDAWTQTFNNPEIYDWLLKQQRGKPQQPVAAVTGRGPGE